MNPYLKKIVKKSKQLSMKTKRTKEVEKKWKSRELLEEWDFNRSLQDVYLFCFLYFPCLIHHWVLHLVVFSLNTSYFIFQYSAIFFVDNFVIYSDISSYCFIARHSLDFLIESIRILLWPEYLINGFFTNTNHYNKTTKMTEPCDETFSIEFKPNILVINLF